MYRMSRGGFNENKHKKLERRRETYERVEVDCQPSLRPQSTSKFERPLLYFEILSGRKVVFGRNLFLMPTFRFLLKHHQTRVAFFHIQTKCTCCHLLVSRIHTMSAFFHLCSFVYLYYYPFFF